MKCKNFITGKNKKHVAVWGKWQKNDKGKTFKTKRCPNCCSIDEIKFK